MNVVMQGESFPNRLKSQQEAGKFPNGKVLLEHVSVKGDSENLYKAWAKMLRDGVSFDNAKKVINKLRLVK